MAWLAGWSRRWKITIPGTQVLENSVDFPVGVRISNSTGATGVDATKIFDELGTNRFKIAVANGDGVTQLKVEIEDWDATAEKACLWVKYPLFSAGVSNIIYLYFDNTQADNTANVGDIGSTPGQAVWSNGFAGVWHLNQTSGAYLDSTSNGINSTSINVLTRTNSTGVQSLNSPEFNTSSHRIDFGSPAALSILDDKTVEALAKSDVGDSNWRFLFEYYGGSSNYDNWYELGKANIGNNFHWRWVACTDSCSRRMNSVLTFVPGTWHYFAGVLEDSPNEARIHIDDSNDVTVSAQLPDGGVGPFTIGNNHLNENWDGVIDEVRFSTVGRSEDWMTQTYNSLEDQFVTWDDDEEKRLIINTTPLSDAEEVDTVPVSDISKINEAQ